MPSCNTYHLTWVSLTLGVGYLFTAAPAKHSHCSLPWTKGISSPLPFLTFNVGSSSRPSCARAATVPRMWGCSSRLRRPQTQGSSSQPFLRHHSLALSAAAPDLRHGVTPLGRCPSGMGSSQLLPLTSDVLGILNLKILKIYFFTYFDKCIVCSHY